MTRAQKANAIANHIEKHGKISYSLLASRYGLTTINSRKKVMMILSQIGPYHCNREAKVWYAV